jgi:hypothetical protein
MKPIKYTENMNPPSHYHNKDNKLKAFVLGCDPTAFDKNNNRIIFNKVFDIGGDQRFFATIKNNLRHLNIELEETYVQNLIPEYRDVESSKDKKWVDSAKKFITERAIEFDNVDPTHRIPVFLTSELLYKALLKEGQIPKKPAELYSLDIDFVIPQEMNTLFRPLVPFYRHYRYSMKNQPGYATRLIQLFHF